MSSGHAEDVGSKRSPSLIRARCFMRTQVLPRCFCSSCPLSLVVFSAVVLHTYRRLHSFLFLFILLVHFILPHIGAGFHLLRLCRALRRLSSTCLYEVELHSFVYSQQQQQNPPTWRGFLRICLHFFTPSSSSPSSLSFSPLRFRNRSKSAASRLTGWLIPTLKGR